MLLGLMERFSYPSIEHARRESIEMFRLLECESWGDKKDEQEELAMQRAKYANEGGEYA